MRSNKYFTAFYRRPFAVEHTKSVAITAQERYNTRQAEFYRTEA